MHTFDLRRNGAAPSLFGNLPMTVEGVGAVVKLADASTLR